MMVSQNVERMLMMMMIFSSSFLIFASSSPTKRSQLSDYLEHQFYVVSYESNVWKDISSTGVKTFLEGVDDTPMQTLKLGFTFPFFGHPQTFIKISVNGFFALDAESNCVGHGFCGWTDASYTRYIAPMMTDFDASRSNKSTVFYQLAEDHVIIQWNDMYLWNDTSNPEVDPGFTFQAVIHKTGDLHFAYKTIPKRVEQTHNQAYQRNYPLVIGIQDTVLINMDDSWVLHPYKAVSLDFSHVIPNAICKMKATPTCLDFISCHSCATYGLSETGLNCGWCENNLQCMDTLGRGIQESLESGCSGEEGLITHSSKCPNPNAILIGAIVGSVGGFLILILSCYVMYRLAQYHFHKGWGKLPQEENLPMESPPPSSS